MGEGLGRGGQRLAAAHLRVLRKGVLVDLVRFLASGSSSEKMLLNTVSLKTSMCRDKQGSR